MGILLNPQKIKALISALPPARCGKATSPLIYIFEWKAGARPPSPRVEALPDALVAAGDLLSDERGGGKPWQQPQSRAVRQISLAQQACEL